MPFADVALNLPIYESFTYAIPPGMEGEIEIGCRVIVPWRKKKILGIIVSFRDESPYPDTKFIEKYLDAYPVLDKEMMQLAHWIAEYYQSPLGEVIHAAFPDLGKPRKIKKEPAVVHHIPAVAESYSQMNHLQPTVEQKKVLGRIIQKLETRKFSVNLLYGVTSSGKTEIYLQGIDHILKQGRNALVLVPEIALTHQLIQRFRSRFGDIIAVMHSGLTNAVRAKEWKRIRRGEARVIIGVRSVIFAPVRNLGLIVVDEEHENTYKQDNSPRYHARDVAIMRGKINNACVILGSATPSLESYYHGISGKYEMLELTKRIDSRTMPECKVIDMRQEWEFGSANSIVSSTLIKEMKIRLDKKEQVILFLNRRGFATVLLCRVCGKAILCSHCSVPLTYHRDTGMTHCHYCGIRYPAPDGCPTCGSKLVRYLGVGTQQVEDEIRKLFPHNMVARLDIDVTQKRGEYEKILEGFIQGEVDILLGTQMIAKGMDIPNVTLVGVINADMMLNLPDFRCSERAYALLTQVSGRAGRGDIPGVVYIQTYNPGHYALAAASRGDRHIFYERELKLRHKLKFPPYRRLYSILIQHKNEAQALSIAQHFAYLANQHSKNEEYASVEVLGPTAAPIFKLKDKYRYHVLFKSANSGKMKDLYQFVLQDIPKQVQLSGTMITVDVDPMVI